MRVQLCVIGLYAKFLEFGGGGGAVCVTTDGWEMGTILGLAKPESTLLSLLMYST